MRLHPIVLLSGFLLLALAGFWLAHTAIPLAERRPAQEAGMPQRARAQGEEGMFRRGEREAPVRDEEAQAAGALPGERSVVFQDQEALERFLARAGNRIRVLGRIDRLHALRISFGSVGELAGLLEGEEQMDFIYPVVIPDPWVAGIQDGAVGFGNRLLEWLGITGDHSEWGLGVKVAVLDTGVSQHSSFQQTIRSLDLVELATDLAQWNGHGTAVASLIAAGKGQMRGVAPGVDVLSVRVANDQGTSNSFLLAQGILAAVDAGVSIVNISMSSLGDSLLVREAVAQAQEQGILIVAAAGNYGRDAIAYPAANEGVVSVGAVDALGSPMQFSNRGEQMSVAAPGYMVNAAWTGDKTVAFTGTSGSTPIVVGGIAALMTHGPEAPLTAAQALEVLLSSTNDGGAPGKDEVYGYGMIDMGRAMNAGTPGIYDAALSSYWVVPATAERPYNELQVVVQNRGTELLAAVEVEVKAGASPKSFRIENLPAGEVEVVAIPLPKNFLTSEVSMKFDSTVALPDGQTDADPSNDRRVETYVPVQNP